MHITSDNVFFFRDQLMQYHSEIELLIFISMLYRHDYLIEECFHRRIKIFLMLSHNEHVYDTGI